MEGAAPAGFESVPRYDGDEDRAAGREIPGGPEPVRLMNPMPAADKAVQTKRQRKSLTRRGLIKASPDRKEKRVDGLRSSKFFYL